MNLQSRLTRLENRVGALFVMNRGSDKRELELLGWAIQRVKRRAYRPAARNEESHFEAMADEIIRRHSTVVVSDPDSHIVGLTDNWVRVLTSFGLDPTPEALLNELR
jgi:hypothetical protein